MLDVLSILLSILVFLAGALLVGWTLMSAVRSFVLPRGDNVPLTRFVFRRMASIYRSRARKAKTYAERDRIMALFAPVTLLLLPIVWQFLVLVGYTFMFYVLCEGVSFYQAFKLSGSSLYTLGFYTVDLLPANSLTAFATFLEFTEATIGLGLIAIVISYLPTMYTAFATRETLVTLLEVRADSPPSAVQLISRAYRIRGLDSLNELWSAWEVWFAQIEESHTSLFALNMFRSPQPDRSWITAAGAVLDAAAIMHAAVDAPRTAGSQLCLRAGYVALRHIADFFRIPYKADVGYRDFISISRDEFEEALNTLAEAGVPIKADRDLAWKDFSGWRVNYDTVLLALCELVMAPYAPWSSDRGLQRSVFKMMK
ncbi:MAG: hypothetical protein LCI00_20325 [Chloroflexi bacterium]|nr:hypothetical protein [Chloroflexota bacterium]MCC6893736.1 hypothetical protein [Anaerolineae bacterium]